MRFKSLPQVAQQSFATRWAAFVQRAEEGVFPIVPVATWLAAFRHINVRIGAGGNPSMDAMDRVVSWVEDQLYGPAPEHGTCDCCGTVY